MSGKPENSSSFMRWILAIFVLLVVLLTTLPTLSRFGIGRLSGDLSFTVFGRRVELPFMSTILLLAAIVLIGKLI